MNSKSAKSKGRLFQKLVRLLLLEQYPQLLELDIKVAIMGLSGLDIKLSPAARKLIPYSFLCKRVESMNIYRS